jgi:hypothetical protein
MTLTATFEPVFLLIASLTIEKAPRPSSSYYFPNENNHKPTFALHLKLVRLENNVFKQKKEKTNKKKTQKPSYTKQISYIKDIS